MKRKRIPCGKLDQFWRESSKVASTYLGQQRSVLCGYNIEVITRRYAVLGKCVLYDLLYFCSATTFWLKKCVFDDLFILLLCNSILVKRVRRTKGQAVTGCALRSVPTVQTTRTSDSSQNIEKWGTYMTAENNHIPISQRGTHTHDDPVATRAQV